MTQKQLIQGAGDGTAVPAGYIGESNFSGGLNVAMSTGTAALIHTYTPPSYGVWMISCSVNFSGGATSSTQQIASINTGNAFSVSPSATLSTATVPGTANGPVTSDSLFAIPPLFAVTTAANPSVYVWARCAFSGGGLSCQSGIRAVRIA